MVIFSLIWEAALCCVNHISRPCYCHHGESVGGVVESKHPVITPVLCESISWNTVFICSVSRAETIIHVRGSPCHSFLLWSEIWGTRAVFLCTVKPSDWWHTGENNCTAHILHKKMSLTNLSSLSACFFVHAAVCMWLNFMLPAAYSGNFWLFVF